MFIFENCLLKFPKNLFPRNYLTLIIIIIIIIIIIVILHLFNVDKKDFTQFRKKDN